MGYDCGRFKEEVDEELLCPICTGVLEDPVQAEKCEHSFCRGCIIDWLNKHPSCPIDRGELKMQQLKPVPRILRNLISRLHMHCEHKDAGCVEWLKLETIDSHHRVCDFNPRKVIQCDKGCKLTHMKCETETHNCVSELRSLLDETKVRHRGAEEALEKENALFRSQINKLQQKYEALLGELLSTPTPPHALRTNWLSLLPIAKISRWGGMISTPDPVLKTVTKRSLLELQCPIDIANQLILNSHERDWPTGLKTLEARQLNRRMYQNYVARRILGRQAVVVISHENEHMSDEFMLKPGLVFVFATGVESDDFQLD